MEIGGRVALGHVAGAVHADEEERQARRAAACQRTQAMADRSNPTPNWWPQQLDVIAAGLGRTQEAHVRHHQRAGEIIGQADAREPARFRVGESHGADELRSIGSSKPSIAIWVASWNACWPGLSSPMRRMQRLVTEGSNRRCGAGPIYCPGQLSPHGVTRGQLGGVRGRQRARSSVPRPAGFGDVIQLRDMVVAAYRRSPQPPHKASTAGSPLQPDDPRPVWLRGAAVCSTARRCLRLRLTKGPPDRRHVDGQARATLPSDIVSPDVWVGQGVAQVGYEPCLVVVGEELNIHAERCVQFEAERGSSTAAGCSRPG